jgi:hypothetical protein
MRYLLLAVLFLPSAAQAFVHYDFDGIVSRVRPAPSGRVIQEPTSYVGSIVFGDSGVRIPEPSWTHGDAAHYQTQGSFMIDIGGTKMIQSGILDVMINKADSADQVQIKAFNGSWSDNGEAGFCLAGWGYPQGTFPDLSYENILRAGDSSIGGAMGGVYVNGEYWDDFEFFGNMNSITQAKAVSETAPVGDDAPVPEPSTFCLFGMGLTALGYLRLKARS